MRIFSFYIKLIIIVLIFSIIFFSSGIVSNAATYKSGVYGAGKYGAQTTVSTSLNTPSTGSSGNYQVSCGALLPTSAPDLFQITITATSAVLYFAPAQKPYNAYFISYGLTRDANQYGASIMESNATGVLSFTVNQLTSHTPYYFKVRALNDCTAGPWSITMKTQTTTNNKIAVIYYKNTFTAVTHTFLGYFGADPAKNAINTSALQANQPKLKNQRLQNKKMAQIAGSKKIAKTTLWSSILSTITHFFSGR